jgi:hypothetical protein
MEAVDSTLVPVVATEGNETVQLSQDADTQLAKVPLDESLYSLGEELATFFKQQTGIRDDEELKRHAMEVQKEAYDVCRRPVKSVALMGLTRLIFPLGIPLSLHQAFHVHAVR